MRRIQYNVLELGGGITKRPKTTRRIGEAYVPQHTLPTFHSGRQSLMVWGATTSHLLKSMVAALNDA
ncbi:hypothetical protein C366_00711 [Cryptococcus neoformans Tu401-1]|nr:hypothetical protein C365_00707 [Cryptococcus neoformans var. grubii Bt85]OXG23331.1 hypothetical protein C366_00711 [Cryptococcus neoformans var. grubii Tu401-1]OXM81738.1 hypothetical protein C364_00710 [Cryptococcus neoformans var. grubii Bt63]